MGAKTTTTSSQQDTQSNKLDPAYLALLNNNVNSVNALGASYQPYTGQGVAPLTDAQNQAASLFTGIADSQTGKSTLDASTGAATGASLFQPTNITAPTASSTGYTAANANAAPSVAGAQIDRSGIQNVNGGLLSGVDLSKYESPYTQSVIDATNADLNNQRLIEQNQNASDATKAGAWRGNALAVTNGVTNGAWDRTLATTDANLRQAGFNLATQNAEADLARGLTAGQSNQGVDLSVAGANAGNTQQANLFNAGNVQEANLANAGAKNAASLFGAGASNTAALANQSTSLQASQSNQAAAQAAAALRLAGSSQLAANSNQELTQAQARAGGLNAVGTQQQAQAQAQLDWLYQNNYLSPQQYQLQIAALRNAATSIIPPTGTTTSSQTGTGTGYDPYGGLKAIGGFFGNLGQFASGGAAAAKQAVAMGV